MFLYGITFKPPTTELNGIARFYCSGVYFWAWVKSEIKLIIQQGSSNPRASWHYEHPGNLKTHQKLENSYFNISTTT